MHRPHTPKRLQNLYVIAGPTASGKSSYSIEFAKKLDGVIFNADSRQVYSEMKIGTAQPIPDEKLQNFWLIDDVKHYLYGHKDLTADYTVVDYQAEVYRLMNQIDKPIVLVGGTGLFIDSIVYDYKFESQSPLVNFPREELEDMTVDELQGHIPKAILDELNDSDRNNPRRLIRVIERGVAPQKKELLIDLANYIVIDPGKEQLESNIIKRTEMMFDKGLVKEVTDLWEKYPGFELKALNSIGYSEFIPYFNGEIGVDEVKEEIILHTRQYAKRQRTWFNRQ